MSGVRIIILSVILAEFLIFSGLAEGLNAKIQLNFTFQIKLKNNNSQTFDFDNIIIKFKNILKGRTDDFLHKIKDFIEKKFSIVISFEKLFNDNCILSTIYRISLPKNINIYNIIKGFNDEPYIEYIEPDYTYYINTISNDRYFSSQWNLKNINCPTAWDIEKGKNSIIIAIVDTGVDYNHPDLKNNILKEGDQIVGYDFVNNDPYPMDDYNHGTHCAGIAAAVTNNLIGIAGVSWNCKIMPIKVLNSRGRGYSSWIAKGIKWAADHNANVISLSLGSYEYSQVLVDAINYAYNKGIVVVAAAGNENTNKRCYPAGYKNVIAVGATDYNNRKASFSNYGTWVDVSAPGVSILSTLRGKTYGKLSGTSMACPHVSGLVALMLSEKPNLSPSQIRYYLKKNADKVNGNSRPIGGIINAYKTLSDIKSEKNGYITIHSPNAGETWLKGKEYQIKWESKNAGLVVNVSLYNKNKYVLSISTISPNDGKYTWLIPTTLEDGSYYRIKITSSSSPEIYGYSEYFTITSNPTPPPTTSIEIISPKEDSVLKGKINITGRIANSSFIINSIKIYVKKTYWNKTIYTYGKTWSVSLDTTKFSDGEYTIIAEIASSPISNAKARDVINITIKNENNDAEINITTNIKKGYLNVFGKALAQLNGNKTVFIGSKIAVTIDTGTTIRQVNFYIDNNLQMTDYKQPYEYHLSKIFGMHSIKIEALDENGNYAQIEIENVLIISTAL